MSWKDSIKGPARFRGVPFFVDTSEQSGGRRNVEHEYPFRDDAPFVEDLGRQGRTFSVEGYVLGADYLSARNALLDALEKTGPGELLHPSLGTLRVVVASYRVRENKHEGGWAQFAIEFKETSAEPTKPTTVVDAPSKVVASAETARTASGAEFLTKFKTLTNLRDAVTGALRSANLTISNILNTSAMAGQQVATITAQVEDLTANAASLADEPDELLATQLRLFSAVSAGLRTVENAVNPCLKMLEVFSFDPGERPPATTYNRVIEQTNFDATQHLIQRLSLIESCLLAVEQTFESYDQALATRQAITDLIDEHFEDVADDTYLAFQQLRADVCNAIPGEAEDLPRLVTHTPRASIPSLVLAHTLYGHLDLEQDLVNRNRVKNPMFIPGGKSLEVLSD